MIYNSSFSENLHSYVNNINTHEGGTHLSGFRRGLTHTLKKYADSSGLTDKLKFDISGDDFREGLTAVISVKVAEPQFEGQTKTKLGNREVSSAVSQAVSKMLENYVPPFDAHVITLLKKHGATILGKANCDEFAMGSSTEHSAFGATHNPHNLECVPGGSSGGSAAAVAGNLADLALGSDTGGSIRCPASFCGIVGLKPTYGLISRYGLIAYGNSLEQIGPMAKTVSDCALLLECISEYDNRDSTCVKTKNPEYTQHLSLIHI